MATLSSILVQRIPWTEEPGRLQSMGSQSQTRLSDLTFTFKNKYYVYMNFFLDTEQLYVILYKKNSWIAKLRTKPHQDVLGVTYEPGFIHSLAENFPSSYYVPGTRLGPRAITMNKREFLSLWNKSSNKKEK